MKAIQKKPLFFLVSSLLVIYYLFQAKSALGSEGFSQSQNHWQMGISLQSGTATPIKNESLDTSSGLGRSEFNITYYTNNNVGIGFIGQAISTEHINKDSNRFNTPISASGGGIGLKLSKKWNRFELGLSSTVGSIRSQDDCFECYGNKLYISNVSYRTYFHNIDASYDLWKFSGGNLQLLGSVGSLQYDGKYSNQAGYSKITSSVGLALNFTGFNHTQPVTVRYHHHPYTGYLFVGDTVEVFGRVLFHIGPRLGSMLAKAIISAI